LERFTGTNPSQLPLDRYWTVVDPHPGPGGLPTTTPGVFYRLNHRRTQVLGGCSRLDVETNRVRPGQVQPWSLLSAHVHPTRRVTAWRGRRWRASTCALRRRARARPLRRASPRLKASSRTFEGRAEASCQVGEVVGDCIRL
jgi:hypothetical protein